MPNHSTRIGARVKQYEIAGINNSHDILLNEDDHPIFEVKLPSGFISSRAITLQRMNHTTVATYRADKLGRGGTVFLQEGPNKDAAEGIDLKCDDVLGKTYKFSCGGRSMIWTPTRSDDAGSKRGWDYQLVDEETGQVLVAYISNRNNYSYSISQIDFHAQMQEREEIVSLVALLRIVASSSSGSLSPMVKISLAATSAGILVSN